jgi:ATP/maltotriose-dependent transcriptional regulator MalT
MTHLGHSDPLSSRLWGEVPYRGLGTLSRGQGPQIFLFPKMLVDSTLRCDSKTKSARAMRLTEREREVLRLIVQKILRK